MQKIIKCQNLSIHLPNMWDLCIMDTLGPTNSIQIIKVSRCHLGLQLSEWIILHRFPYFQVSTSTTYRTNSTRCSILAGNSSHALVSPFHPTVQSAITDLANVCSIVSSPVGSTSLANTSLLICSNRTCSITSDSAYKHHVIQCSNM